MKVTINTIKLPVKNNIMGEIINYQKNEQGFKQSVVVRNESEFLIAVFSVNDKDSKYYFGKINREIKELRNCINDFFIDHNLVV
jgi:hypothetical protein